MTAPIDEEAVADLVRAAASAKKPIAIAGNGTKRHHGQKVPDHATLVSINQLARITTYDPGDMVVTAEAGVRLAGLQDALRKNGQWLPIDPPYAGATIGGILAANSTGPRRLGYGGIKDMLLGARVCGATGAITKSGGRVVKNVTGYDLHKLHVGAFGSLAVLLEANFKVRPLPEKRVVFTFACDDVSHAHQLLLAIWASPLQPVALEVLGGLAAPPGSALAVVGVEGSHAVVERHARDLPALTSTRGPVAASVMEGADAENFWIVRRDLLDRFGHLVAVRIGSRPHDLPGILAAAPGAPVATIIQAGLGIAHAFLDPTLALRSVPVWHKAAAAHEGYAVVEAAPVEMAERSSLAWSSSPHALDRTLKAAWDPQGILNPGTMAL